MWCLLVVKRVITGLFSLCSHFIDGHQMVHLRDWDHPSPQSWWIYSKPNGPAISHNDNNGLLMSLIKSKHWEVTHVEICMYEYASVFPRPYETKDNEIIVKQNNSLNLRTSTHIYICECIYTPVSVNSSTEPKGQHAYIDTQESLYTHIS